jgi:hypothetical protein
MPDKKRRTAIKPKPATDSVQPLPENPSPVTPARCENLTLLSQSYMAYFDVPLPIPAGNPSAKPPAVQVRRLTAAEDAEVNLIVRRILPSIAGAGQSPEELAAVTPADRERFTRELEAAQAQARTKALLKAVPIIADAAAMQNFRDDLTAATAWLQGFLPEDVLATLFTAVTGESPSVSAAKAVRFF